jgi:hypothetical protein
VNMDPVGPWSYAYNRLASVQTPANPSSGDFHHHLATIAAANAIGAQSSTSNSSNPVHHSSTGLAVHPSTSQLLLQSGFSSNFLTSTQPSSTPSNIAYETVFSPFLTHAAQHSNPKPAHFNNLQTTTQRHRTETYQLNSPSSSQHQQITNLTQQTTQQQQQSPQNSRRTESYQSSTTTANTNNSNSYFEQVISTPTAASTSAPESGFGSFGVMPHESLVSSSLNGSSNKTTTNNYGNINSSFNPVGGLASTTQQLLQQQSHHQLQQNASRSK